MSVIIRKKVKHTDESYERAKHFFGNRVKRHRQKMVSKKDHTFFDGWSACEIRKYCEENYGSGVYWVFVYGGQPPIQTLYIDPKWKEMD